MNIQNLTNQEVEQLQMLLNKMNPQPTEKVYLDPVNKMSNYMINKMKYEIIKTDNYLLVVDESEIKEGDWYYYENGKTLKGVEQVVNGKITKTMASKKIISHLPLNGSPILEGVDLLPPLEEEDEVEKLLKIDQVWSYKKGKGTISWYELGKRKEYYNKAKEKYNLTLEKILDLYIQETGYGMDMWSKEENAVMSVVAKIIQSLSQPKMPVRFERYNNYVPTMLGEHIAEAKTTTTPEGHTQWIGTYIY